MTRRVDTDSGIYSSGSGGSSFCEERPYHRSYHYPYTGYPARPPFYPPPSPSARAAASWQQLLLTALPPHYLLLTPQSNRQTLSWAARPLHSRPPLVKYERFGTLPRAERRGSQFKVGGRERWGELQERSRQGRVLVGRKSSSCSSCEEDESLPRYERERGQEVVTVKPEVRRRLEECDSWQSRSLLV